MILLSTIFKGLYWVLCCTQPTYGSFEMTLRVHDYTHYSLFQCLFPYGFIHLTYCISYQWNFIVLCQLVALDIKYCWVQCNFYRYFQYCVSRNFCGVIFSQILLVNMNKQKLKIKKLIFSIELDTAKFNSHTFFRNYNTSIYPCKTLIFSQNFLLNTECERLGMIFRIVLFDMDL